MKHLTPKEIAMLLCVVGFAEAADVPLLATVLKYRVLPYVHEMDAWINEVSSKEYGQTLLSIVDEILETS